MQIRRYIVIGMMIYTFGIFFAYFSGNLDFNWEILAFPFFVLFLFLTLQTMYRLIRLIREMNVYLQHFDDLKTIKVSDEGREMPMSVQIRVPTLEALGFSHLGIVQSAMDKVDWIPIQTTWIMVNDERNCFAQLYEHQDSTMMFRTYFPNGFVIETGYLIGHHIDNELLYSQTVGSDAETAYAYQMQQIARISHDDYVPLAIENLTIVLDGVNDDMHRKQHGARVKQIYPLFISLWVVWLIAHILMLVFIVTAQIPILLVALVVNAAASLAYRQQKNNFVDKGKKKAST